MDSTGDRNGELGGGIFVLSIGVAVAGVMFVGGDDSLRSSVD
jgi:hypothetical protein